MTTTPTAHQLACVLALRDPTDYPADTCTAWMDSQDRVCGNPTTTHLCPRHETVARRRLEKMVTAERDRLAKAHAKRTAERPKLLLEFVRINLRLERIDPARRETGAETDPAMVNLPLSRRMPSDSRISELAELHTRREQLQQRLGVSA